MNITMFKHFKKIKYFKKCKEIANRWTTRHEKHIRYLQPHQIHAKRFHDNLKGFSPQEARAFRSMAEVREHEKLDSAFDG